MEQDVHLGEKIRGLRRLKGIKQETLAKGLGIVQQNVSKMEQKKDIPLERLERAAQILGVSVDELQNFDERGLVNNNFGEQRDVVHYNINPLEKVTELYEELLKAKQEVMEAKDALIRELQQRP